MAIFTDEKNKKTPVLGIDLSKMKGPQSTPVTMQTASRPPAIPAVTNLSTTREQRISDLGQRLSKPTNQTTPKTYTVDAPIPREPAIPQGTPVEYNDKGQLVPVGAVQPTPTVNVPPATTLSGTEAVPAQFDSANVLENLSQIRALPLDQQRMILEGAQSDIANAYESNITERNATDASRGITNQFATGLQGAIRDRFLANVAPVQRELERVQQAQESQQEQEQYQQQLSRQQMLDERDYQQQQFENELAQKKLELDRANVNSQIAARSITGGSASTVEEAGIYQILGKDRFNQAKQLSQKFLTDERRKAFVNSQNGLSDILSLDPNKQVTGPEMQSVIFAFMKVLDPDSVVREGEFATAQKYADSYFKQLGVNISRIFKGRGALSKDAIKKFQDEALRLQDIRINNYSQARDDFAVQVDNAVGVPGVGERLIINDTGTNQGNSTVDSGQFNFSFE